jgi:type II secretory pathway pseudopilin PulG
MKTASSPREAGYNLVMLVVAVTVMNIMIAAVLPLWSQAIRREKEEELVFRGFQYAEAIRVFHVKYQRYPNKLEELMEVKPRSIRQLWKDPMTEDGKWGLIFQNDPRGTPLNPQPPGQDPNVPNEGGQPGGEQGGETPDGRPQLTPPRKGETVQIGPIIGVYSKSSKKSVLILFGRERYDEWRFTEDQVVPQRQQISPGLANPNPTALANMSTRWTGRPMRFVNQIPGGSGPGGQQPGLNPSGENPGGPNPQGGNPPRGPRTNPRGPR